jgi:hypothetical protein
VPRGATESTSPVATMAGGDACCSPGMGHGGCSCC